MVTNPENWPVDAYTVKYADRLDDGGWSIGTTDSSGFGTTAKEANEVDYEPKPGDEIILYGGLGHTIKGIVINGHVFRYKTREQAETEHQEWVAGYERQKEERFYANIADWIKRKDALPKPYRDRMNRFINKSGVKEFWTEDGGYELFSLEQSAMMVEWAEGKPHDQWSAVQWLDDFKGMSWDEQKKWMPKLSDGHSGNTFGAAVGLAKAVLEGRDI